MKYKHVSKWTELKTYSRNGVMQEDTTGKSWALVNYQLQVL